MNYEKQLDEILKTNDELRKVLEKHPERRALYLKKMRDSDNAGAGCNKVNPKKCMTCRFSRGEPPFEDSPMKAYCMIYSKDEGEAKPPEVYYDGGDCEYYKKDKG